MKYNKIEISLPQIIEVSDYHEFHEIQNYLEKMGVYVSVTELGVFENRMYTGLVHEIIGTDEEESSFQKMKKEFRDLEESEMPFDFSDILSKYYKRD